MKKYYTIVCLLIAIFSYSQIIIGETKQIEDGVILQIDSENKGILFPIVSLTSRTSQAPLTGDLPTGTLIYNTNTFGSFPDEVTPGFFWWDNEYKQWKLMASNLEIFTAKFNNIAFGEPIGDSNDDYYQAVKKNMKIFGNTVFNERYDAIEVLNDTSLKFNYSGLYAISVDLTLNKYGDNPPIAIKTDLALDDIPVGSSHYIKSSAALTSSTGRFFSGSFTEYINVEEGQVLTLQSIRATLYDPTRRVVGFDSLGSSSITISRIR